MKKETKIYFIILVVASILLLAIAPGRAQIQYDTDICVTYVINEDGSVKEIERQCINKIFILTKDNTKLITTYNQNESDVYNIIIDEKETSSEELIAHIISYGVYIVIDKQDNAISFFYDDIMIIYRKKKDYEN